MAKRQKTLKADADGYLITGIYQRYVGPPRARSPEDRQKLRELRRDMSAKGDLSRLRDWLVPIVTPYVQGPIPEDDPVERGIIMVDFGNGLQYYREKPDQPEQVRDALLALEAIHTLETLLVSDGEKDSIFRVAFQLGELCERIQVRPFEHATNVGRAKINNTADMRDAKVREDQRRQAEQKQEAIDACNAIAQELALDAATGNTKPIKSRAAKKLGISTRQLTRRLGGK